MSTMWNAIMSRSTDNGLEAKKDASQVTEKDFVYNPNTQTQKEFLITNIVVAPDNYCYGRIKDNGKSVDVSFSPFKHCWSR